MNYIISLKISLVQEDTGFSFNKLQYWTFFLNKFNKREIEIILAVKCKLGRDVFWQGYRMTVAHDIG